MKLENASAMANQERCIYRGMRELMMSLMTTQKKKGIFVKDKVKA